MNKYDIRILNVLLWDYVGRGGGVVYDSRFGLNESSKPP